jgi:NAD(P)-dependent dehydrogenase (short-subunit alcohol dehydrogenase family)
MRSARRSSASFRDVTTTLITGANRGLGFEVARQLAAAGHQVWIGARDQARGQQAADALGAGFVQLDVTDDASVAAATETVGALDVLVNNAGISGGRISPSEATVEHMRTVYETNVFGPVRVLRAFIPLLENSPAPVVVNVSSGVGSLSLASDPESPWSEANFPVYASSKAALNMLTIRYAAAFPEDADQLCRSGLHRDRLQRPSRHTNRRAGCRCDRPLRADRRRRTNRGILRRKRHRTLVT